VSARATNDRKQVTFRVHAPEARTVLLCGDFSDWQQKPLPMRRLKNGDWTRRKALSPGDYQYRFVVDGQWVNPPDAETAPNEFGGQNCICRVS